MLFKKSKIYLTLFVILPIIAASQVTTPATPATVTERITTIPPTNKITNTVILADQNNPKEPLQAGYTLALSHENIIHNGLWDKISTDLFTWRITYEVKDANYLNLYMSDVKLGYGDRLFIYDQTKTQIRGAFTSKNNGKYLSTDFIAGDHITVEYNTTDMKSTLPFTLLEVGVKLPSQFSRGFGDAGACEVQANCEEGADWQKQRDGVARILVKQGSATFWCSGTLINNARIDGTPYFLTANHCGETASTSDYSQWLFYFNFQSEDCAQPVFEPEYQIINGAKLLSHSASGTSAGSDFKLLLLSNQVTADYHPYYNGWNRNGEPSPSGVTIHHPQGDIKKISTYTNPLISAQYNNISEDPAGKYWGVYWSETQNGHGVTEGGSSGSPIFNNAGLVVGSLTGGGSSCTFPDAADYYGKLSTSWETITSKDSNNVLSYWLDPDNTGIISVRGTDLDTTNLNAWFSAESTSILIGESIEFINSSFGNITSYQWEFQGGEPAYSELKEPGKITYANAGVYNVKLSVFSSSNSDSLIREQYIHVMPNISPNPGNGRFTLAFGDQVPQDLKMEVFDIYGAKVNYFRSNEDSNSNSIEIDLSTNRSGVYLIRLTSSGQNNTYRVILTK